MIASHLGRYSEVNFIFADQTYGSISKLLNTLLFNRASWIFSMITCWECDAGTSTKDFLYAKCYKIIA
jgi:hypothetical protein